MPFPVEFSDRQPGLANLDALLRWLAELEAPPATDKLPDESPAVPAQFLTPLTPEERTILEALADEYPTTVTQEDLTTPTHLSVKTIRKWLTALRERSFVNQPRGPKKGFAITPTGLTAIGRKTAGG
jgi:DNA-binding MarR family transcriptional regulator